MGSSSSSIITSQKEETGLQTLVYVYLSYYHPLRENNASAWQDQSECHPF